MKIIITTKDDVIEITEQEFGNLKNAKGLVYVKSLDEYLNLSFIYRVVSEEKYQDIKKTKLKDGRLHDGTRVTKKFGAWVALDNPEIKLDPNYYTEIAKDEVMSEDEWDKKQEVKKLK